MGLLGGIGRAIGKVAKGVGSVVKKAAPLAAFIPGFGPLAAAGIGAGASLLGGAVNGKLDLGGALLSGALAGGGNALGAGKLLGGAKGAAGGLAGIKKAAPLSGLLNFAKKNPALVLGGVQALNAGAQNSKAAGMRDRAVAGFTPEPIDFGQSGNPYARPAGPRPARAAALRSLASQSGVPYGMG